MKGFMRIVLRAGTASAFLVLAMRAASEEPPVELISSGVPPGKAVVAYQIKVNTDKPINEVHLNLKETDATGKVVVDTMLVWQNIVHSTRQPIEKGKTYDDDMALSPGAVAAECSLKEVVFKDSTRWTATASATSKASAPPAQSSAIPESGSSLALSQEKKEANSSASKPSSKASDNEGAEGFIKALYHDMEENNLAKVLAYFDATVDYYAYGPKDQAFIGEQLRQYFEAFPVRTFSVSNVKFQASSKDSRASATFEVRYTLENPAQGTKSKGHSQAELGLIKRGGVPKIIRFTGTSTPDS